MVENLLHAPIVLSKKDVKRLRAAGSKWPLGAQDGAVGTITFLGTHTEPYFSFDTVSLLIRFESYQYDDKVTPPILEKVFGRDSFLIMHGNGNIVHSHERRVLITVQLTDYLMNPQGFIYAKAQQFAKTIFKSAWDEIDVETLTDDLLQAFKNDF